MFRSKQSAVVLYSNMIKKPACFLCLDTYNLRKCSLCGEYMCERHSHVHYGDDGQCYPFRVEFRNELGKDKDPGSSVNRSDLNVQGEFW